MRKLFVYIPIRKSLYILPKPQLNSNYLNNFVFGACIGSWIYILADISNLKDFKPKDLLM